MWAGSGAGTAQKWSWRFLHLPDHCPGDRASCAVIPDRPRDRPAARRCARPGRGAGAVATGAGRGPDPRARRRVRHQLAVILDLAVCAVLAGARSFTAIAEWAADADRRARCIFAGVPI